MTTQEFERRVQSAKALDFGDIFSKSIELFKKVWVQGLVMLLLTMVVFVIFYFLMLLPLIGAGLISANAFDPNTLAGSSDFDFILMIPFFLFALVFSLVMTVLGLGMRAGFYRICKMKDLNETGVDDYFYYFKKPYLGKLIKLSLVSVGISAIAAALCYLPLFYVIVPLTFMNLAFTFNPEQSVSEIIKSGFALGNKKWLIGFGLMFVSSFLAIILGSIMCLVGIFVTISFAYIPAYFIYKESIGFDEADEIQEIGGIKNL